MKQGGKHARHSIAPKEEQHEVLAVLTRYLPALLTEDVKAMLDELQRLPALRYADSNRKMVELLSSPLGKSAQLMKPSLNQVMATAREHDAQSLHSAGQTALLRLLHHELAQRDIERQLERLFNDGRNEATWCFYEYTKKTLQRIFASAESLAPGVRRADPALSGPLTQHAASGSLQMSGAVGNAAQVAAEATAEVLKAFPFLSLAGTALQMGLDQRAMLKFAKEGERIGKVLDRTADGQGLYCDAHARALAELRMEQLQRLQRELEEQETHTGAKGKSPAAWLGGVLDNRLKRMGVKGGPDPKETKLEGKIREMVVEDARAILVAMCKGEIDLSDAGATPFGQDKQLFKAVLKWYAVHRLGHDENDAEQMARVAKIAKDTAWGERDAQVTRSELKQQYHYQLQLPRRIDGTPPSSVHRLEVGESALDKMKNALQAAKADMQEGMEAKLAAEAKKTNEEMAGMRQQIGQINGKLDPLHDEFYSEEGKVNTIRTELTAFKDETKERKKEDDLQRKEFNEAIETTQNLGERLAQQESTVGKIVDDLGALDDEVDELEATVNGKADGTYVARELNTLRAQATSTLAALRRELAQKPDLGRTVQHLDALWRQIGQINHALQQLPHALNGKVDHAQLRQQLDQLTRLIDQALARLQADSARKADAAQVTLHLNNLAQHVNQALANLYQTLGQGMQALNQLQAAMHAKADTTQVNLLTQQQTRQQERLDQQQARKATQGQIKTLTDDVSGLKQTVADLNAHDIHALRLENQMLGRELEAQRRRSARIEVQANLKRLTPRQTQETLQVYFSLEQSHDGKLLRNSAGEVTQLRSWNGLRKPLAQALQSHAPQGCTLQELSQFLARQGMTVTHPAQLQNAVFTVLDIAEQP